MPLTKRQKEERRKGVGASEVASLFGYNKYDNAGDVYLRIVQGEEDPPQSEEERRKEEEEENLGNIFEETLVRQCMKRVGMSHGHLSRNCTRVGENPRARSTLDGLFTFPKWHEQEPELGGPPPRYGCEAKLTSLSEGWGDPFDGDGKRSDIIPKVHIFQTTAQCYCADLNGVFVTAFLIDQEQWHKRMEIRDYFVPRSEALIEKILAKINWFYDEHIDPRIPPKVVPHKKTMQRAARKAGKKIQLGDNPEAVAAMMEWLTLRTECTALEKKKKAQQDLVTSLFGDAEVADFGPVVGKEVTYFTPKPQTRYGKGDKYTEAVCDKCGVGRSVKTPARKPTVRNRRP